MGKLGFISTYKSFAIEIAANITVVELINQYV